MTSLKTLLSRIGGLLCCLFGHHDWGDTEGVPLLAIYCKRCDAECCSYR